MHASFFVFIEVWLPRHPRCECHLGYSVLIRLPYEGRVRGTVDTLATRQEAEVVVPVATTTRRRHCNANGDISNYNYLRCPDKRYTLHNMLITKILSAFIEKYLTRPNNSFADSHTISRKHEKINVQ